MLPNLPETSSPLMAAPKSSGIKTAVASSSMWMSNDRQGRQSYRRQRVAIQRFAARCLSASEFRYRTNILFDFKEVARHVRMKVTKLLAGVAFFLISTRIRQESPRSTVTSGEIRYLGNPGGKKRYYSGNHFPPPLCLRQH